MVLLAILGAPLVTRAHAAFPGKNGKIAFNASGFIDAIEPDGTGRTHLIVRSSASYGPAWSADGQKIAFTSYLQSAFAQEVFTADSNGANATPLPLKGGGFRASSTAWSPDGTKLVSAYDEVSCQYYCYSLVAIMNTDGTGLKGLFYPAYTWGYPAWSPSGNLIALEGDGTDCFESFPGEYFCNQQIWTIHPDGTGATRISDDTAYDMYPNWSPDGTKIAFTSRRNANYDIYVMKADGSGVTRLTNSPGPDVSPAWSPDGQKIAFATNRDGNAEIYVMNADGTGQTNLTNSARGEGDPDWQPLPLSPADFKNAAQFCKAERALLGEPAFGAKYGNNGGCVNQTRRG